MSDKSSPAAYSSDDSLNEQTAGVISVGFHLREGVQTAEDHKRKREDSPERPPTGFYGRRADKYRTLSIDPNAPVFLVWCPKGFREAVRFHGKRDPKYLTLTINPEEPVDPDRTDRQIEANNQAQIRRANRSFRDIDMQDYLLDHTEGLKQRCGSTQAVSAEEAYWRTMRDRVQLCECTEFAIGYEHLEAGSSRKICSCLAGRGTDLRHTFQAGVHNDLCTSRKHATAMRTRWQRNLLIFKCNLDIGYVNSLALNERVLGRLVEITPRQRYKMLHEI